MHNQLQPAVTYDDEIDLRELFSALWLSRRLIAIITTTTTALALIYVLLTPNQYQADAVLAPTEQDGGGLSSALS
jgi:LPS O-antigen subunit length determinant protein (WzzB/FepE family)